MTTTEKTIHLDAITAHFNNKCMSMIDNIALTLIVGLNQSLGQLNKLKTRSFNSSILQVNNIVGKSTLTNQRVRS